MERGENLAIACEKLIGKGNLNVIDSFFTREYIAHAEGNNYEGHGFSRAIAIETPGRKPSGYKSIMQSTKKQLNK